jgi:hypothetical protein
MNLIRRKTLQRPNPGQLPARPGKLNRPYGGLPSDLELP